MRIQEILDFVSLLNKFQKVERTIYVTGEDRQENDAEHSYQLAMLAWFIADSEGLNLNKDLLIKYALVHDLVEVYAGDVSVFTAKAGEKESKHELEKEAADRLGREYPKFNGLHNLISEYEERKDPESKFIYALDKLQPMLNIYNDGGRTWRKHGISLQMLIDEKKEKVALSPEIQKHYKDFMELLEEQREALW